MTSRWQYLTLEDLLQIAVRLGTPAVRDLGLLDAAAFRPRASAFGEDAYPSIETKAAALLVAIARNHGLVDGNKRLAWSATVIFCRLNDHDLRPPSIDAAYELVIGAATGTRDVDSIAPTLSTWVTAPRP